MSNKSKTEKKLWPDKKKLPYPLLIEGATNARVLTVIDPNTGEVLYTSPKFNERDFISKYKSDEIFKSWFDYGSHLSAEQRIGHMLFRTQPKVVHTEAEMLTSSEVEINEVSYEDQVNSIEVPVEEPVHFDSNEMQASEMEYQSVNQHSPISSNIEDDYDPEEYSEY